MLMMRPLFLIALAACAAGNADTGGKSIAVELSAVTLADDCAPPPPPPATKVPGSPAVPSKTAPQDAPAAARCAGPNCGRSRCDQTSMQLMITSAQATTIQVTKVELLDDKGKLLQVLTSRDPKKWSDPKYVAWDEKVAAGGKVQAMYDLSMPDWGKVANGRWRAHEKTFQLRVTVAVGGANKTALKQSITPVRLPPPVPT
jgi:hypothetical protein